MRKFLPLLLVALLAVGTAFGSTVNVTVYQNVPASGDASNSANYASGLPHATFTSNGINFQTSNSTATTLANWLGNPTFTSFNGFNPNGQVNNSELVITGTIGLNAGNNSFVVGHDDGVVLQIPGFGSTCSAGATTITDAVVCSPGATPFITSPFNVTAATTGNYAFTLYYSECCGGPADLLFKINDVVVGSVPEPGSLALMSTGLFAFFGPFRKFRKNR